MIASTVCCRSSKNTNRSARPSLSSGTSLTSNYPYKWLVQQFLWKSVQCLGFHKVTYDNKQSGLGREHRSIASFCNRLFFPISSKRTRRLKAGETVRERRPRPRLAKQVDKALVRFVNGTAASKDLAFGDLTTFAGIDSFDITQYKELPADRHESKLFAKDQKGEPLATNSEGLSAGKQLHRRSRSPRRATDGKQSLIRRAADAPDHHFAGMAKSGDD